MDHALEASLNAFTTIFGDRGLAGRRDLLSPTAGNAVSEIVPEGQREGRGLRRQARYAAQLDGAILEPSDDRQQGGQMGGEIAIAAEAVTIATAAIGMYGRAVLAKAWDDVADVTIKAGLQVLQKIFGRKKEGDALPGVLADVVAFPADSDVVAQFRLFVRRSLEADPRLARDVAAIVAEVSPSVSVSQRVVAGHDAYVAGRDMTITQPPC